MTRRQTSGRGQHGRSWLDLGSEQLFVSLSLNSTLNVSELPIINLATALSCIDVLMSHFNVKHLSVKWPNDIYIHRFKIGGVISEMYNATAKSLIVGVGVNLNGAQTDMPSDLQNQCTSLASQGYELDRIALVQECIDHWDWIFSKPNQDLHAWVQSQFRRYNLFQSENIKVKDKKTYVTGIIKGVDHMGRLLLETQNNGNLKISTGRIQL